MAVNIEQARFNMIEQQIRTWDVLDRRVLDTLQAIPREDFVPSRYRKVAFTDVRLPIGHGQVMMKPVEEGRLLQALQLEAHHSVLEVGTGSGFLSTCLAHLGESVISVEIIPELVEWAQGRLARNEVSDVEVIQADALDGQALPQGPFDCVVLTASAAKVPEVVQQRVKVGGCLFAIQGHSPAMEAVLLRRTEAGWQTESLFETDLPRLIGAEDQPHFEF